MTDEERKRLSALEKTVKDFSLTTSGVNVQGGFPKLENMATDHERLSHLEKLHEDFRIIGGQNTTVEGSLKTGFAICSTCPDASEGAVALLPGIPPTTNGACCIDGECSVRTEQACINAGGEYQGDGSECTPIGACCFEDNSCTETTEDCCTGAGGTYQGDATTCDPNPCETVVCPCSEGVMFQPFFNPDDGLYYRTVESDCCALMTTYSNPVLATARFGTLTAHNEACNPGYSGSTDCSYRINDDCEIELISCSGDITHDGDLHCIEGCSSPPCDVGCETGSCEPNTRNTTTLSDECTPP